MVVPVLKGALVVGASAPEYAFSKNRWIESLGLGLTCLFWSVFCGITFAAIFGLIVGSIAAVLFFLGMGTALIKPLWSHPGRKDKDEISQ